MKIQISQKPAVIQTMKQSQRKCIHPYLRYITFSFCIVDKKYMRSLGSQAIETCDLAVMLPRQVGGSCTHTFVSYLLLTISLVIAARVRSAGVGSLCRRCASSELR